MKKQIKTLLLSTGLLLGTAGIAFAFSAGDQLVQQRDPTNSFTQTTFVPLPASSGPLIMDTSTNLPTYAALSTGLSFDNIGKTISVANVPESAITNLSSDLAAKLTVPSGTTSQYVRGDGTLATLPLGSSRSFTNTATHTIQTVAAAANGFQLSSTQDTSVFYSINTNTTATISGASDGYVVLEISPTNSAVAANWTEIARSRNGQTISLAIALQSIQNITTEVMGIVPTGYYVRLRSVNVSGTPAYTYVSGQEVQL